MTITAVGILKSQLERWLPYLRAQVVPPEQMVGVAYTFVADEKKCSNAAESQCVLLVTDRKLALFRLRRGATMPDMDPFRRIRGESITQVAQVARKTLKITNHVGAEWEVQFVNARDFDKGAKLVTRLAGVALSTVGQTSAGGSDDSNGRSDARSSSASNTRPVSPSRPQPQPPSRSGFARHRGALIASGLVLTIGALILFNVVDTSGDRRTRSAVSAQSAPSYTAEASTSAAASPTSSPSGQGALSDLSSIDAAFAETLTDYGITIKSPSQAVSTARTTCRVIGKSPDPARAIVAASEIAQTAGGFSASDANNFVGLAIIAYCPEFNEYVRN